MKKDRKKLPEEKCVEMINNQTTPTLGSRPGDLSLSLIEMTLNGHRKTAHLQSEC